METIKQRLELLGVKQAGFDETFEKRFVVTEDPSGIYFLFPGEQGAAPEFKEWVQLIFLGHEPGVSILEWADYYAAQIGYVPELIEEIPCEDKSRKAISARLRPWLKADAKVA